MSLIGHSNIHISLILKHQVFEEQYFEVFHLVIALIPLFCYLEDRLTGTIPDIY